MIQRLNKLIGTYQDICFKVISSYDAGRGMWGCLGEMRCVSAIRSVFISRTRSVYHCARCRKNIVVAYTELRKLLNHPIAQELELMTETAEGKSCGKETAYSHC